MRPGVDGFNELNAVIPLIGALGAAMAVTSVRKVSQTEPTATLLAYQSVFVGTLAGVPLFWLWTTPDTQGVLLLAMGGLATVGQWVRINALRLGEASVIGNMEYSKLIYAAILGYAVFGEMPDVYTVLGPASLLPHRFTFSTARRRRRQARFKCHLPPMCWSIGRCFRISFRKMPQARTREL